MTPHDKALIAKITKTIRDHGHVITEPAVIDAYKAYARTGGLEVHEPIALHRSSGTPLGSSDNDIARQLY